MKITVGFEPLNVRSLVDCYTYCTTAALLTDVRLGWKYKCVLKHSSLLRTKNVYIIGIWKEEEKKGFEIGEA